MKPSVNRILGTLYGVAIGDAMGMPSETWPRNMIKERFGTINGFLPGQDDHPISSGFAAGETTDDTAMTFLISRLLIDFSGDMDSLEFVKRVEKWAESTGKSNTVIGPSTRFAFEQIKTGVPINEAGKAGTTNGASMRISPAGIVKDYADDNALIHLTEKICMPTHYTSVAISAAASVAASVSFALRNDSFTGMRDISLKFARLGAQYGNNLCCPSVYERLKLAYSISDNTSDDEVFLQKLYDIIGTGLPSNESVPSAIAVAFRCKDDVMRCARLCANIGGDTDTIGAIACAICGSLAGFGRIDKRAITTVKSSNLFDFEGIAQGLSRLTT